MCVRWKILIKRGDDHDDVEEKRNCCELIKKIESSQHGDDVDGSSDEQKYLYFSSHELCDGPTSNTRDTNIASDEIS